MAIGRTFRHHPEAILVVLTFFVLYGLGAAVWFYLLGGKRREQAEIDARAAEIDTTLKSMRDT